MFIIYTFVNNNCVYMLKTLHGCRSLYTFLYKIFNSVQVNENTHNFLCICAQVDQSLTLIRLYLMQAIIQLKKKAAHILESQL